MFKRFVASVIVGLIGFPQLAGSATQTLNGGFWLNNHWPSILGTPVMNTTQMLIDAGGEQYSVVTRLPKSGTIGRIGVRFGGVTSAQNISVGVYNLNAANGNPDPASAYGGMSSGTISSVDIVANTLVFSTSLSATAVAGDIVAFVLDFAGTVGNLAFSSFEGNSSVLHMYPYAQLKTGGSWTKQARVPILWIEYSDGSYSYIPMLYPASSINTHTINTGTTPDEMAIRFSVPIPTRLSGFGLYTSHAGDFKAVLYSGSSTTTILTTDTDYGAGTSVRYVLFRTSQTVSITADTVYRLAIQPTSATSLTTYSITVGTFTAPMNQIEGGTSVYSSSNTNSGTWQDATATYPLISVLFDQFDDAVGGACGSGYLMMLGVGGDDMVTECAEKN